MRRDVLTVPRDHNKAAMQHLSYTLTLAYKYSFNGYKNEESLIDDTIMLDSNEPHFEKWRVENAEILNNPKLYPDIEIQPWASYVKSTMSMFLEQYFCLPYVRVTYFAFNY